MPFKRCSMSLLISSTLALPAFSEEPKEIPAVQLDTIVVSNMPFSQQAGTQKITSEEISHRPTNNGTVTELLKNNPNVQFSNNSGLSVNAGEISPENVSFHGERFYNNNFMVDGISNNSNINPDPRTLTGDAPGYGASDLPADNPQSFFLDSSLYKSVEVFDSNISAKYGQFTGGVVDAKLKDPTLDRPTGKIFYRTSRSAWDHFHWQEGEKEGYENPRLARQNYYQPEYKKQQYGVIASQPLSDKAALLFSYTRTESDIPYRHSYMNTTEDQRRINETYYLRGVYLPDNGDLWKATVIYSPHREKYLKYDVKNGAFTNTGGGVRINLEWEKELSWAKMESYLGYQQTRNQIKHEANDYISHSKLFGNYDWSSDFRGNTANEGGYGKYSTGKQTFTLKQDYEVKSFDLGETEHRLQFGWQADFSKAKYKRDRDTHIITEFTRTMYEDTVRYARQNSVNDSNYALYLEDNIRWKNLEVTPGIRFDYNEFLKNKNIAPRLSMSYDLLGNKETLLFGGYNRYYSGSILAYRLRDGISATTTTRYRNGTPIRTLETTGQTFVSEGLKTPYSDEYTLGISQKFLNSQWTFKWVNRHGKDQFVRERENRTAPAVLTNNGHSKSNTFTLTVNPESAYKWRFAELNWSFGAQISRIRNTTQSYDVEALDNEIFERAIWNGKMIDLPALDYNNQWSAFLTLNTYFPQLRLNWDQRLSYTDGFKHYSRNRVTCPTGHTACRSYTGTAYEYAIENSKNAFVLDWRFSYKQPTFQNQYIELTLDINNVLDAKVSAAGMNGSTVDNGNSYKLGRNYWLGISYNW